MGLGPSFSLSARSELGLVSFSVPLSSDLDWIPHIFMPPLGSAIAICSDMPNSTYKDGKGGKKKKLHLH